MNANQKSFPSVLVKEGAFPIQYGSLLVNSTAFAKVGKSSELRTNNM